MSGARRQNNPSNVAFGRSGHRNCPARSGAGGCVIGRAAAVAVAVLSIAMPHTAVAESARGGTFLPMGWSARGAGLGGAASILIRDDRSAFWNPANICYLLSPRISIGTTKPVPGLDNWYTVLSAGMGLLDERSADGETPLMKRFGVAVTATHLGLELAGGSGWNEGTLGLSLAFSPNHYNSIGITYRMMKSWSDLDDAGAWGMAVDAGWTAILTGHVWFAVVGRNIYSSVSYPNIDEELDPVTAIALAYEGLLDRISLESDAVMKGGVLNKVLVGSEIRLWGEALYLSGGAEMRVAEGERTILSFGVGSVLNSIETVVAFVFDPEDAFGRQARGSVSYLF